MVIGINDAGALGAYQAFQEAIANGRDPESIFVGGMDGQTEALELIADGGGEGGIYRASGALILDDLGRAVADLPADLIEGKDVSVLELPYELVTPADTARAQEIVDTYNSFTADVSADTSAAGPLSRRPLLPALRVDRGPCPPRPSPRRTWTSRVHTVRVAAPSTVPTSHSAVSGTDPEPLRQRFTGGCSAMASSSR